MRLLESARAYGAIAPIIPGLVYSDGNDTVAEYHGVLRHQAAMLGIWEGYRLYLGGQAERSGSEVASAVEGVADPTVLPDSDDDLAITDAGQAGPEALLHGPCPSCATIGCPVDFLASSQDDNPVLVGTEFHFRDEPFGLRDHRHRPCLSAIYGFAEGGGFGCPVDGCTSAWEADGWRQKLRCPQYASQFAGQSSDIGVHTAAVQRFPGLASVSAAL